LCRPLEIKLCRKRAPSTSLEPMRVDGKRLSLSQPWDDACPQTSLMARPGGSHSQPPGRTSAARCVRPQRERPQCPKRRPFLSLNSQGLRPKVPLPKRGGSHDRQHPIPFPAPRSSLDRGSPCRTAGGPAKRAGGAGEGPYSRHPLSAEGSHAKASTKGCLIPRTSIMSADTVS
jgi:hypothetical protein